LDPAVVLGLFVLARLAQFGVEFALAAANRRYYLDPVRQSEAQRVLGISEDDMAKTLAYSTDKHRFGVISGIVSIVATLVFLGLGGLGVVERTAQVIVAHVGGGEILKGLAFFALLGLLSFVLGLPFDLYRTFRVEARHGFNKQSFKGFVGDRVKGLLLAVVLGGGLVAGLLWIMGIMGELWWLYAWIALTAFSIFTAWAFPIFISPLFNKFSPLPEGELKAMILDLASRIGFRAGAISVMDGSKRSSHGNAYFTGAFGAKKIVLFDTLVDAMSPKEVVAVLAHELGHFKLHHVRWSLIRGTLMAGVTFFLLAQALPLEVFYRSFGLDGVSNYAALVVFSLWFGLVDFFLQPFESWLSRRNEFAADAFARTHLGHARDLGAALLKLREKSHLMPISHPLFSAVYYSHPPLMERLAAMGAGDAAVEGRS